MAIATQSAHLPYVAQDWLGNHTLTNMHNYYCNNINVMLLNCNKCKTTYMYNNSRDFMVSCLDCHCFHDLKCTDKLISPKRNLILACVQSGLMIRNLQYGCTCTWSCICCNLAACYKNNYACLSECDSQTNLRSRLVLRITSVPACQHTLIC